MSPQHEDTHPTTPSQTPAFYPTPISSIRHSEYPNLAETTYLDHAGTTPYASSLITRYTQDLLANLYGNPHSSSSSSQLSTHRIEDIRHAALRFFNADPADFDMVFVANATAGIKLVMEALREEEAGFWFGYHRDAHTSLVGVREGAKRGSRCFEGDGAVEAWLGAEEDEAQEQEGLELFAYPAQSNMNGRRLPLDWCRRVRQCSHNAKNLRRYTLLDAASLVSTAPLDLSDKDSAPDFTVLSFYKIFGFPDLGALIVRKESADILRRRAYFGGGTVDMVVCMKEQWHAKKTDSVHDMLEDGTLPIHNIMALGHAFAVHKELFGLMHNVSRHTAGLAAKLHEALKNLKHGNGLDVCEIYRDDSSEYTDRSKQGPIIAFNVRTAQGAYLSTTEVEKLATIRNIQLRTGGLCNPGGVANALGLAPWDMRANFSAGQRCGNENDIVNGKPTGMIRVSLGAMSSDKDVQTFLDFMTEFFVDETIEPIEDELDVPVQGLAQGELFVESVTVYPIKSCAGWKVPEGEVWDIRAEGLAWDREWCLVHQGTGAALSQKKFPRMALIRPHIDLIKGVLRVHFTGHLPPDVPQEISVALSADPRYFENQTSPTIREQPSNVCGDKITAQSYTSPSIAAFFTAALGVPCTLARFPAAGAGPSLRHAKAHLKPKTTTSSSISRPILLSNESPILVISRSSLNRLNEQVKSRGGRAPQAEVFRANIVLAQSLGSVPGTEQPYAEDAWTSLTLNTTFSGAHVQAQAQAQARAKATKLKILGPCRRCQMVCVDQTSGDKERSGEPFVTLSKTRRWEGKVWFGVHACLEEVGWGVVTVGQKVVAEVETGGEEEEGEMKGKEEVEMMVPGQWPEG